MLSNSSTSGPWATVFSGTFLNQDESTQMITKIDTIETHLGQYFKFVCHNYYGPNCALQYIKLFGMNGK